MLDRQRNMGMNRHCPKAGLRRLSQLISSWTLQSNHSHRSVDHKPGICGHKNGRWYGPLCYYRDPYGAPVGSRNGYTGVANAPFNSSIVSLGRSIAPSLFQQALIMEEGPYQHDLTSFRTVGTVLTCLS